MNLQARRLSRTARRAGRIETPRRRSRYAPIESGLLDQRRWFMAAMHPERFRGGGFP